MSGRGVMLLVNTTEGGVVAVKFPSTEAARDWEDRHGVETSGCVPSVGSTEALRLATT